MNVPREALERLGEPLRLPIQHYAARLHALAGDRVLSLTVFAAAAAGTFDFERHSIHNAVVFDQIDLDVLRQIAAEGTRLGKYQIAAPLVFTPTYLKESCDTFPLELIEIQQQHVIVFGQDYFQPLTFADADVRLQCERELKVVQIAMHQGLLISGGREIRLKELALGWTEHLLRTLRGLLWLKGQHEGRPATQVVQATEKLLDRSLPGVWAVLGGKDGTAWHEFHNLYADVQALGQFVNAL